MKIYLSINFKFMTKTPYELVNFIKKYDTNQNVKGLEIYFDYENDFERNYTSTLVSYAINYGYEVQFHGNSEQDIKKQYEYLDMINDFSLKYQRKFNIVLHPCGFADIKDSILKSNLYFSQVLNYIYQNNYGLNISIENLNSVGQFVRCSKENLISILSNNEDLYFTYDIGHEIVEYGQITDLKPLFIKRLINVHIHTFNNISDHLGIDVNNDLHKEMWLKGLIYLNNIKYKGPLVLEFDLYKMGDNFEEAMLNYLKIAKMITNYLP
jgi:hypothetical protein